MSTNQARGNIPEQTKTPTHQGQSTVARAQTSQLTPLEDDIQFASDTTSSGIPSPGTPTEEQKPPAKTAASEGGSILQASVEDSAKDRQTIAVSASRGPAAFFNLARKFLVTDEMCDLSALEGAIVSAVDAAHLLERSKLATIVRVQTSYVTVEPKRKKQHQQQPLGTASGTGEQSATTAASSVAPIESSALEAAPSVSRQRGTGTTGGRELRRARIVITVKRTESYERWLEENPLQAIMAGDGDDDDDETANATNPVSSS